jgi:hypothetical protein
MKKDFSKKITKEFNIINKTNKRAIFFSTDALIGLIIIFIGIIIIYPTLTENKKNDLTNKDFIYVYSSLKVGEVDDLYIQNLIVSKQILDSNKTIIEMIGELYVRNRTLAKEFTDYFLEKINSSENIGIYFVPMNDLLGSKSFLISSRNSSPLETAKNVEIERQFISGISNNSENTSTGYSARAYLLSSMRAKYFYFGGYVGDGNLSILINYSGIMNDTKIEIAINDDFELYINSNYSGFYEKSPSEFIPKTYNLTGYLLNFNEGNNLIEIRSNKSLYIAGGYIRITYYNASLIYENINKIFLPGVNGLINIYDGFYVPGYLNNLSVYLHYNSSYNIYMIIGNVTVYNSSSVTGVGETLNDSYLSAKLNYNQLSNSTIPIRIGMENATISFGGKSDAVLITDRTSSMDACDVNISCDSPGICDSTPPICNERRDKVAQSSDEIFINEMLAIQGNNVGLIGYGQKSNNVCDYHFIQNDNNSLQSRINDYYNEWCGYTCISCGIQSATELLVENKVLYQSKHTNHTYSAITNMGDAFQVYRNNSFNFIINRTGFIKSRLTVYVRNTDTSHGYRNCVYINGRYIGRLCEPDDSSTGGWHNCQYVLKPDWLIDGNNVVTLTAGNMTNCYGTNGDQDEYSFREIRIDNWESNYNMNLSSYFSSNNVALDDGGEIRNINFNTGLDLSKIRAGYLTFEAFDVNPPQYDCVYINNYYIGRIDYDKWSGTNTWQEIYFEIPVAAINSSDIEVKITSGTTNGCLLTVNDNDFWIHRNVNLTIISGDVANSSSNYNRFMSMLVMSDGQANTRIGYRYNYDTANAAREAATKACEAKQRFGIRIYSVAFGGQADTSTMRNISCCDDCSHSYNSSNSQDLLGIYKKIANEIITLDYSEQTSNLSGNFSAVFYPDSYIEYNYTMDNIPYGLIITAEKRFNDNYSGNLTIPSDYYIVDANVISYSGPRWTDKVILNNKIIYNLTNYGKDFSRLGDPYSLQLPQKSILEYNTINLTTGLSYLNSTQGSQFNKIIYTTIRETLSYSLCNGGTICSSSEGCIWTITFDDGTISTNIPKGYSGPNNCQYGIGINAIFNTNDAIQTATYNLLRSLDFDSNGILDVKFTEQNLDINLSVIKGIPYSWSSEIQIRRWR